MEQQKLSRASEPPAQSAQRELNITVVSTSLNNTVAAMHKAAALADELGARITLLVTQLVPHPLPLDHPPVDIEFNEQRFRELASECPIDTNVQIHLCRDREETLPRVLDRTSIVVLGGRRRKWWPTAERRLARRLRRAGFEVVLTETE